MTTTPRGLDRICQPGTNPLASAAEFRLALREEIEDALTDVIKKQARASRTNGTSRRRAQP